MNRRQRLALFFVALVLTCCRQAPADSSSVAATTGAGVICAPRSHVVISYGAGGSQQRDVPLPAGISDDQAFAAIQAAIKGLPSAPTKVEHRADVDCRDKAAGSSLSLLDDDAAHYHVTITVKYGDDASTPTPKGCTTQHANDGHTVVVDCGNGLGSVYGPDGTVVVAVRDKVAGLRSTLNRSEQSAVETANQLARFAIPVTAKAYVFDATSFAALKANLLGAQSQTPLDLGKAIADLGLGQPTTTTQTFVMDEFRAHDERAAAFAGAANASRLSPAQLAAYDQLFTATTGRLDQATALGTSTARRQIVDDVDNAVQQLATVPATSPTAAAQTASYRALLSIYAPDGIVDYPQDPELSDHIRGLQLKTSLTEGADEDRATAQAVREQINRAVFEYKVGGKERAFQAAQVAIDADAYYAAGADELGDATLDRAKALVDYETNDPRVADYKAEALSDAARAKFGLTATSETFEGYELIHTANDVAATAELQDKPLLSFQAAAALHLASLEASGGNLGLFVEDVDQVARTAAVARGAAVGLVEGGFGLLSGLVDHVKHPVDSVDTVVWTLVKLPEVYAALETELGTYGKRFADLSPYEQGKLAASMWADILPKVVPTLPPSVSAPDFDKAMNMALLLLAPEADIAATGGATLTAELPELQGPLAAWSAAERMDMAVSLAKVQPNVVKDLVDYGLSNHIPPHEIAHIGQFSEGVSYFISEDNFNRFVVEPNSPTLGRADGQFVTTRAAADEIEKMIAGGGVRDAETGLGLEQKALGNGRVYRVDLPFRTSYSPTLPRGKEIGANKNYLSGGYTPAGYPEILVQRPPTADIVGGKPHIVGQSP